MNKSRPPVDGRCDECGFDYDTGDLQGTVTTLVRQSAECSMALTKAAAGPESHVVRIRPAPEVWSAIEYACHVRDVLEVQRFRIAQCLAEDRPVYAPMDRTGRVKEAKYEDQDPMEVAAALVRFAREFGSAARVLTPPQLGKLGLYNYPVRAPRSLGWVIRHTAHEIQHHRQDIIKILAVLEPPIVPAPRPAPVVEDAEGEGAEGAESADGVTAEGVSAAVAESAEAESADVESVDVESVDVESADAESADLAESADGASADDADGAAAGRAGRMAEPSPEHAHGLGG